MSSTPPSAEVGLATGIRHESGDRTLGRRAVGPPASGPATSTGVGMMRVMGLERQRVIHKMW